MKSCTIEILDEVNVKIHGLEASTRRKLQKRLRVFNPSAKYSTFYKMGAWNGYIQFFSISGGTYFYLLEDIIPILLEENYHIDWEDKRKKIDFQFEKLTKEKMDSLNIVWPENHPNKGEKIQLRDYQIEAINDFLENLHGIKEIPTGSGKTIITAMLSKIVEEKTKGNTITIVPSKNLVLQTESDFKLLGLDVGVFYGDKKEINHKHIISTWQSLESVQKAVKKSNMRENFLKILGENLTAVIVDECHSAKGSVLKNILTGPFSSIPLRFGITATIPKYDHEKIPLIVSLGKIIDKIEIKELQEKGFLADCKVSVLQFQEKKAFSNYNEEREWIATNEEVLTKIAKEIEKNIAPKGNTLVLINRVSTGKALERKIKGSVFLSGRNKAEERKTFYEKFSTEDNLILIATYGICSVGINIPRIFNLVMIEPGKSFIRVIQSIGRGLRKTKDKKSVEIFDISFSLKYSKRHLNDRLKYYEEVGFKFQIEKIN